MKCCLYNSQALLAFAPGCDAVAPSLMRQPRVSLRSRAHRVASGPRLFVVPGYVSYRWLYIDTNKYKLNVMLTFKTKAPTHVNCMSKNTVEGQKQSFQGFHLIHSNNDSYDSSYISSSCCDTIKLDKTHAN